METHCLITLYFNDYKICLIEQPFKSLLYMMMIRRLFRVLNGFNTLGQDCIEVKNIFSNVGSCKTWVWLTQKAVTTHFDVIGGVMKSRNWRHSLIPQNIFHQWPFGGTPLARIYLWVKDPLILFKTQNWFIYSIISWITHYPTTSYL